MMQAGIYMIYQNTYVKTMGVVTPTMYGVFIWRQCTAKIAKFCVTVSYV